MPEWREGELREALVGTWFAIALFAELLIAAEITDREYLLALLSDFENQANPGRRHALSAIRGMVGSTAPVAARSTIRCRRFRGAAI